MKSRRDFLQKMSILAGGSLLPILPFEILGQEKAHLNTLAQNKSVEELVTDEHFWATIKNQFTASPTIINLNNGGVSPAPRRVQEAVDAYNRMSNELPSIYMWRHLDAGREGLRKRLADLAGADAETIAITRNATEALNTIVFGLPLKASDEIVVSNFDYPNMTNAWLQRQERDGIILKTVKLTPPHNSKAELIQLYTDQFTTNTKLVHITHVINWCGQVLPVKEIAAEARKKGIEVLVDGAHSFVGLNYKIADLGADYFGTSLHKWLCAPFGTGMLHIKKEKIAKVYPLLSSPEPKSDLITKFEHLGTRSFPIEFGIGHALDFHALMGSELRSARLLYLRNYWLNKVKDLPDLKLFSPENAELLCVLVTVGLKNKSSHDLAINLYKDYQIHCINVNHENVDGLRISPNIYTSLEELDRLVMALKTLAKAEPK